jgi:16S rRNA (cytosine1402-N4)-methyltransferase
MDRYHVTAMTEEAVRHLSCRPGKIIVDGTLGGAGHARRICKEIRPNGFLIGIDRDRDAVEHARSVLLQCGAKVHIVHANFVELPDILHRLQLPAADGILLDLGLSLHQIEASGRGFSFNRDEPLDMRMDVEKGPTAEELVNSESETALTRLFRQYGEEPRSRSIARRIVATRKKSRIRTSRQLADIVLSALPAKARHGRKIHPATRAFMALRIAVNRELEHLERFLEFAIDCLNPGGRLCVLSFHSLEDRMVKHRFQSLAGSCSCPPGFPICVCGQQAVVELVTRKALRPSPQEIEANPMSRSTRMRVVEKTGPVPATDET